LNKETGKEVFIGRTSTPIDALFAEASKLIQQHFVSAGEPALTGESATAVSDAVQKLEKVIAEAPDLWNAQWYYGKGQLALGNHEVAYQAFSRAYDLDKTTEIIPRELAGVCLELKKFDEAVTASEAAVALDPSNAESLGNLALSYLMAGRIEHAQKAIDAAIKMAPDDKINHSISRILSEVIENRRPQPESLRDLSTPAKRKKKKFLGVSW
jgi:Flp pilus assembly protein TadD